MEETKNMIDNSTIDKIMESQQMSELIDRNSNPLVYGVPIPHKEGVVEQSKRRMFEGLRKYLESQDFDGFMVLFEKTQKLEAFFLLNNHLPLDKKTAAELFKDAWAFAAINYKHVEQCKKCFAEYADLMMDKKEKEIYNNLPDEVKIFRGTRVDPSVDNGISWSLDKKIAKKFMIMPNGIFHEINLDGQDKVLTPNLREKIVPKNKIICYLNDRKEKEVIYWD